MPFLQYEVFDYNFASTPGALSRALDVDITMTRMKEYANPWDSRYPAPIYPQFHILTADFVTRNKTLYTYTSHKGRDLGLESFGQFSFTRPYRIPLIEMHRVNDGVALPASKVYGRMVDAKVVKNKNSGMAHLAGLGEVPHPEAINEILSGIWLTGSLGSTVHDAHCSICNSPLRNKMDIESHPHAKGGFYRQAGRGEEADDFGYTETDPRDKAAMLCYVAVDAYRAIEYSKVVMPSDINSVVDVVDTRTEPGSHFTGIPYSKPPPYDLGTPNKTNRMSSELAVPTSSIWVPMRESSSKSVSSWGERYVDVVTGREVEAEHLGLLYGLKLHEYVEQVQSNGYFEVSNTSIGFPVEEIHQPEIRYGSIIFTEETTCPACEGGECLKHNGATNTEAKLSRTHRDKLKGSAFCGPDRSFPVHDKPHYTAALRLLGRYKGSGNKARIRACILRKGRKNGWS